MIVVMLKNKSHELFPSCVSFIEKVGRENFGSDTKTISNSDGFKIYGGSSSSKEEGLSAELIIKKTINLKEDSEEEFYRKLNFFFENANVIMENFTDGDE